MTTGMYDPQWYDRARDYADDLAAYADDDPIAMRRDGFRNRVPNEEFYAPTPLMLNGSRLAAWGAPHPSAYRAEPEPEGSGSRLVVTLVYDTGTIVEREYDGSLVTRDEALADLLSLTACEGIRFFWVPRG